MPDAKHDVICIDPPSTTTATNTAATSTSPTTAATTTATATTAAAAAAAATTAGHDRPLLITPLAAVLPLLTSGYQLALQHQV